MLTGKWFAPEELPAEALALRAAALGDAADAAHDALCHTALLTLEAEAAAPDAPDAANARADAAIPHPPAPDAMGQLYWADGAFWLTNVCVREGKCGQGLGDTAVRLLLYRAQGHGAREARLRCPAELCAFFARYGFAIAGQSGPGAPLEMALDMRALQLSHCHGGACGGDCAHCGER